MSYNPHQNIFYYYRGPSDKENREEIMYDKQIEDNTTKSLINTLELCDKELLLYLLKKIKINLKNISKSIFNLQVSQSKSRPDARIIINDNISIYLESKVSAHLAIGQLKRHLNDFSKNDILIVITKNKKDKDIIRKFNKRQIRFITWSSLYNLFVTYYNNIKKEPDKTIIKQFVEYLEVIQVISFNGWSQRDFDFFVNIDSIQDRDFWEEKRYLKTKMNNFIDVLKEKISRNPELKKRLVFTKVGKLSKKSLNIHYIIRIKKFACANLTIELWENEFNINLTSPTTSRNDLIELKKRLYEKHQKFMDFVKNKDFLIVLFKQIDTSGKEFSKKLTKKRGRCKWVELYRLSTSNFNNEDFHYVQNKLDELHPDAEKHKYGGIHIKKNFERKVVINSKEKIVDKTIDSIKEFLILADLLKK